jgi:hypothetical protein
MTTVLSAAGTRQVPAANPIICSVNLQWGLLFYPAPSIAKRKPFRNTRIGQHWTRRRCRAQNFPFFCRRDALWEGPGCPRVHGGVGGAGLPCTWPFLLVNGLSLVAVIPGSKVPVVMYSIYVCTYVHVCARVHVCTVDTVHTWRSKRFAA